jgi:hypothetical protein
MIAIQPIGFSFFANNQYFALKAQSSKPACRQAGVKA